MTEVAIFVVGGLFALLLGIFIFWMGYCVGEHDGELTERRKEEIRVFDITEGWNGKRR